jgi:HAMP domain-containing protein
MEKTRSLANQSNSLQQKLTDLSRVFDNNLKSELSSISSDTKRRQRYNIIAFFTVVACAGIFSWLIISRSIIYPLKKTVIALNDITKGDLSTRLPTGIDEIGLIGAALNAVVEALIMKAKVASDIAVGNLIQEFQVASGKDTLGKALMTMITNLNKMVSELHVAAAQVDSGSR